MNENSTASSKLSPSTGARGNKDTGAGGPARRWLAAAIASASLAVIATPALAEPAPTLIAPSGPVISAQEMAQQYARQTGVPLASALRRMESQERAHGLIEELRKTLRSRYAGVWIDGNGMV